MPAFRSTALTLALLSLLGCGGGEPESPGSSSEPTSQSTSQSTSTPPAPAVQSAAAPRAASGAAIEYPAVVTKFPDAMSEEARQLIFNTKGVSLQSSRAKGTWSALSRSLEQAQPQIEALLRVTEMKDCTFAAVTIDKDARKLPPDLLELFRGMRNSSGILAADAARCYLAGDTSGATRRAAAIASMLRHLAESGLPKAADLALAPFGQLEQIVPPMAAGVNGTTLTESDRATLLAALNMLNAADPCGMAGGTAGDALAAKQAAKLAAMKAALGAV